MTAAGPAGRTPIVRPALIPICALRVDVGEPLDLGATRDGARRITPILGGELVGLPSCPDPVLAVLEAEVLPGGADRQLLRPDGGIEIDARYQARTASGALLDLHATGLRRPDADGVYFRVALRFATADPELAELERALHIADGVRDGAGVRHTVFRVE